VYFSGTGTKRAIFENETKILCFVASMLLHLVFFGRNICTEKKTRNIATGNSNGSASLYSSKQF